MIVVVPVYKLTPVKVSVPVVRVTPPVPDKTPVKLSLAFEMVKVLLPSRPLPAPDRLLIDAPLVVPEISNVPPSAIATALLAIEPVPLKDKVVAAPIFVLPEYRLAPASVSPAVPIAT